MHDHGIRMRLYDSHGYLDEYDAPVISNHNPSDTKGELTTGLMSRPSGTEFTVEIDMRDFNLYSASGVAVIIACGHGLRPPGGFEHIQYYWLEAKDMKTHAFDFASYDTWHDECAGETVETPYTMPPPRCDIAGVVVASTSLEPFYMTKGSVAVYVQRGHVVKGHHGPWHVLAGGSRHRDVNTKRPFTDPPVRRIGIFRNSPITMFDKLGGNNGRPCVFEYKNVVAKDCAGRQLRAHDLTPDHHVAGTGAESPDSYDSEDSDSLYDSDESDGNSSVTASDTDTIGSARDLYDTELDVATGFPLPVEPTRKRKRGSDSVPEHHRRLRRHGAQCGTSVQASHSKIHEADEDDEEPLPTKVESPQSTTVPNITVTARGALQAPSRVASSETALVKPAVEEHEEEDLYGDSRHPSLYNEPAVEHRNAERPGTADPHAGQPSGRVDQDEHVNTSSSGRRRATLLQHGRPPTPIDLTADEVEDSTQVKQESEEAQSSVERNPVSARAGDVASDDEDGLKILAEEIRLKREDVRLQMEELQLRKKMRELEKKRRPTRR
ncbi:hypothetical protein LTR10_000150 [Elasticomyces elasticus]|nr:hypothetical protein LTR10_000150 [Elasticomyces elasticus]KAK4980592.1 hypothetical protein LTR42_000900 [Elasticomyces elasticus]